MPINLEDKDKLTVLIQLQRMAADQMMEIKRDEMSWLNRFLLFYGSIMAWQVTRFFAPNSGQSPSASILANDITLLEMSLLFSFMATLMFVFLFIHTRHSYYGVASRLHKIQKCLGLDDPSRWDNQNIFPAAHSSGEIKNVSDWSERTKPWSSFCTRVTYVIGANLAADFLAYGAFERMGQPKDKYFIYFWIVMNVLIILGAYVWDFIHFSKRGIG